MPSVVYASESPDALDAQYEGRAQGYTYAREGHPNADVLARRIDALEGMQGGIVLGSGMAAVTAVLLGLCRAGDHVLGGDQLYGRSLRLMKEDLPRLGIATSLADPTDVAAMAAALRPETKLDAGRGRVEPDAAGRRPRGDRRARRTNAACCWRWTTPSPRRCGTGPSIMGADIVIHSVTKLLAGHSDVTLGMGGRERGRA